MSVTKAYENITDPSVLSTLGRALRDRIALCREQLNGTAATVGVSLTHHTNYWTAELDVAMQALAVVEVAALHG